MSKSGSLKRNIFILASATLLFEIISLLITSKWSDQFIKPWIKKPYNFISKNCSEIRAFVLITMRTGKC
jgi:hypothetical protein